MLYGFEVQASKINARYVDFGVWVASCFCFVVFGSFSAAAPQKEARYRSQTAVVMQCVHWGNGQADDFGVTSDFCSAAHDLGVTMLVCYLGPDPHLHLLVWARNANVFVCLGRLFVVFLCLFPHPRCGVVRF